MLRHPRATRAALKPCLVPHRDGVLDHTHAAEGLLRGWLAELDRLAPALADAEHEMAAAVVLLDELAAAPPGAAPLDRPTPTDPPSLEDLLSRCDAWRRGSEQLLRQVDALGAPTQA